jgi:hypothetical protein
MSAPFGEDGVGTMMTNVEKCRVLIEQNARLIDKQSLDQGMQAITQG